MGEGSSLLGKLCQVLERATRQTVSSIDSPLKDFFAQTFRQKISAKAEFWKSKEKNDRKKILKEFHGKFQADATAILEEWLQK